MTLFRSSSEHATGLARLGRSWVCRVHTRFLRASASGRCSEAASPTERGQARTDAWSTRMREKYGLDTSDFGYDPAQDDAQSGPSSHPIRQDSAQQQRRCAVM